MTSLDFFQEQGFVKQHRINRLEEQSGKVHRQLLPEERMYCQLLNAERNKELLENVPHERIEDLAVIVRCLNKPGPGTVIAYDLCRKSGLNREELFRIAKGNSRKGSGYRCRKMNNVLSVLSGDTGLPLYILMDSLGFGASALLFPDILRQACGESVYILPCSIHELILVPESFVEDAQELSFLEQTVREVNREVVLEEDEEAFLSDNVYHYDRETGILTVAGASGDRGMVR